MAESSSTPRDAAAAVRATAPTPGDAVNQRRARLWAVLHDDTADQATYFQAWLTLQCDLLPGASGGLLLLRTAEGESRQQAIWPGQRDGADLARLGERALAEQRSVIAWGRSDPGGQVPIALFVAQPLGPDGAPHAVVVVAIAVPGGIGRADPEGIARQLRAAGGWLESWRWRAPLDAARQRLQQAAIGLDVLAASGEHRRLAPTAMAIVNNVAARLDADRVSLGLARRSGVRLQAMSHAANFQKASRIVDAIEDAMDEALGQQATVSYPPVARTDSRDLRQVALAHRELAAAVSGRAAVASVVLPGPGGHPGGVLTIERHGDRPFSALDLQLAETVAALTGPLVALHGAEHRWISGRLREHLADAMRAVFGPARPALKLAVSLAVAALATLALATGEYRVSARAVLEGEIQRAATAPFDGFIRTATQHAGDTVREGDVLATLDDRDLLVDRQKFQAELDKLIQKHREALAKHDRSAMAVLTAQIAQAQAELALAAEKLARSRVLAPFDGIIVAGDLRQMLGSPIERGKVLFELAPLDAYRLVVQADEREVRWIEPGQRGRLALAGMPMQRLGFAVTRVTPVATAEEGRNYFRIEASLDAQTELPLRPGMEGIAKIDTGPRRLLWIWTHSLLDWMRLTAWQWWP